ncbi:hypothetical protein J2S43_002354 [Catenuloplanes nepalensis]|uniref:Uncharacterized protein n=1 Tax=Catenuloplanes nepalensis TaxID=587533 RepID=A0ABT9MQY2_9ACTN|nr:hypothetical protein [Catenuloplanes nepalensis]MDP9793842.1 hypothetical protein [Catenuloplanes nepalensis]
MAARSTHLDPDALLDRAAVERADLIALVRAHDGRSTLIARDARTGGFCGLPLGPLETPRAVSYDGTRFLVSDLAGGRLLLRTVGGDADTVLPSEGEQSGAVAFSPDGTGVAMLNQAGGRALLSVVDLRSRGARTVWTGEGAAEDLALTWSPGGRFLAATYVTPDDTSATVVVGHDGALVAGQDGMEIVGSSHRAWLDDHRLLLVDEFWPDGVPPIVVLDPATGARERLRRTRHGAVLGAAGGRLLHLIDREGVVTETTAETDRRPFLIVGPDLSVAFLDVAPGASPR